jgi:hypothetical protein
MADPKQKEADKTTARSLSREENQGWSIRPCHGCPPHEFQDKEYGGKRVKNFSKVKGWACTVCSRYESTTVAKK